MWVVILQVLGSHKFHLLAFHVIQGNQVIVRGKNQKTVESILDCLKVQVHVLGIGHFTVVCSATKPMNGCKAASDLALIQTSLLLSCKLCCCNAN